MEDYHLIEGQFINLLSIFDDLCDCKNHDCDKYHKQEAYNQLVNAIKGSDLENHVVFIKWKEKNKEFQR